MKTLIRYEIADGCPLNDDKIPFTIPLKSNALLDGHQISPSLKNVYNKFSVRYFIRLGVAELDEKEESLEKKL